MVSGFAQMCMAALSQYASIRRSRAANVLPVLAWHGSIRLSDWYARRVKREGN